MEKRLAIYITLVSNITRVSIRKLMGINRHPRIIYIFSHHVLHLLIINNIIEIVFVKVFRNDFPEPAVYQ